ncbi:MAG: patatin-like phospholipase family protein [Cytophagales bacterium]
MYKIAFLICALLYLTDVKAQSRPKIGLALSGGGVRGLAHIGILKAIDRAGLKVDFIAGTSIGAVVGGLYAAGYSADSIEKIALSEDWNKLIGNQLSLKSISIEEKAEYNKYISEFEVKKGKFQLPTGLIEGQELTLELTRLFLPVYKQRDFKKYCIPFVCMATNIATGMPVILDSGNIVTSIRASMAISSIFTPVEIENRLLVDGGLVYNFPVDIVKKMGADFVIGVDIGEPLRQKSEIKSLIDVFMQINSFADLDNFEKQKHKTNLLIEPNLNGIYGADFSKSDTIIKKGVETGDEYYPILKNIKDSLDKLYPAQVWTHQLPTVDTIHIEKVEIIGNEIVSNKLIMYHLRNVNKKTVAIEKINEAIKNLYGTRYFKHIRYEIIATEDENILKLNVDEIPGSYAKFAVNYHSFLGAALILNATVKHKIGQGSKIIISANIGEALRWKSEFYKYIGKKHKLFFQTGVYFNRLNFPIYQSNGSLTNIYKQNYFAVDCRFNKILRKNALLGIGIKGEDHVINPEVGLNFLFKRANYTNLNMYAVFEYNSLDNRIFPKHGISFSTELSRVSLASFRSTEAVDSLYTVLDVVDANTFTKPFQQLKIYTKAYSPISKKLTLISGAQIGLTAGVTNITVFNDFGIGGITPLYRNNMAFVGFFDYEYFRPNAIIISEGLQWEVKRNIFFTGQFNVGSFQTKLEDYINKVETKDYLIFGGSISVGFNTFLGPVHITAMRGSSFAQDIRIYLNIGHNF